MAARNCSWIERGLIEVWDQQPPPSASNVAAERPPSQKSSGLKPPSKVPPLSMNSGGGSGSNGWGGSLRETSQSDLNARSAGGVMMPPPPPKDSGMAQKHKIPGPTGPASKRKTLVERGGEPTHSSRSQIPPPTSKYNSTPSLHSRSDSAYHSRAPSSSTSSYRNASTAAVTSVTSAHPSSRQTLARANSGISRPVSVADSRVPSAAAVSIAEEEDTETGVMGKRKGTPPVQSSHPTESILLHKTRTRKGVLCGESRSVSAPANAAARSQHSGSRIRLLSSSSPEDDASGRSSWVKHSTTRSTSASSEPAMSSRTQTAASDGEHSRKSKSSLITSFTSLSLLPNASQQEYQHCKTSGPKPYTKHRPSLERIKEEVSPSKIPKFSCTPSLRHVSPSQTPATPSPIKTKSSLNGLRTPVTSARRRMADSLPVFLTKEKLTPLPAWDTKGRLEDMEHLYYELRTQFVSAADSNNALEESLGLYKNQVQELAQLNKDLTSTNRNLSTDLDRARGDLHTITMDLRQARRDHEHDMQELERKHERELGDLHNRQEKESRHVERELERIADQGEREMHDAKRTWEQQRDQEVTDLKGQHWQEVEELKAMHQRELAGLQSELDGLKRSGESRATESATEVQALREALSGVENQLAAATTATATLRSQVAVAESKSAALEQEKLALVSKTHFLEGNQEAQSLEFTSLSEKLQDAVNARNSTMDTLRKEEMLRRKLNATILELRGNIRVFVRTRPVLAGEDDPAKVEYPDVEALDGGKEMVVHAPTTLSATGKERNEKHQYAFDRVFGPTTANSDVFDECRDLIQSVVDGYNVSILSYGQTGSGKTHGMSGPAGIIPSSISLLLAEMARLHTKGWSYVVDASFLEVYNETLNDLLGDAKTWDDVNGSACVEELSASVRAANNKKKEKHEIHHDSVTGRTSVTNLTSVQLWPPPSTHPTTSDDNSSANPPSTTDTDSDPTFAAAHTERVVAQLLDTAAKNRRVAATKANERSSRSHSIFTLTLRGTCAATQAGSHGVLHLVDLAGSERLKHSGAEGARMKETQAINKSLSALGDVIASLGNGGKNGGGGSGKSEDAHVPYRNSKLTYLLQSSLGGTVTCGAGGKESRSSRTLMLLHLSPLRAHWQESRSSLLFGSKVNGTVVGKRK